MVTTCSAWHVLSATDADPPCKFSCIASCTDNPKDRLIASDGNLYCSICALQRKSCDSGFEITGPLPEEARPCAGKIQPENRGECCAKWELGCAKEGENCCTTPNSVSHMKCGKGSTCVLSDFGFSELEVPNSGVCRPVSPKQHACAVGICSRLGKDEICQVGGDLTTCGTWGTPDRTNKSPSCIFECDECEDAMVPVYGSNGKKYCSTCLLERDSCNSAFSFHGPIEKPNRPLPKSLSKKSLSNNVKNQNPAMSSDLQKPTKCEGEILPHDMKLCCLKYQIGCVGNGAECSSSGGMVPSAPCRSGNICVISDFGFAALDVPNSGICREASPEQMKCSIPMCSRLGQEQLCQYNGIITICGSWGTPSHGHGGPECPVECPTCLQRIARVQASDGSLYCSTCNLEKASCSSHFRIFGPTGPFKLENEDAEEDLEPTLEAVASPEDDSADY